MSNLEEYAIAFVTQCKIITMKGIAAPPFDNEGI